LTVWTLFETGAQVDRVRKGISVTAEDALSFLQTREDFWQQLSIGNTTDSEKATKKKQKKKKRFLQ